MAKRKPSPVPLLPGQKYCPKCQQTKQREDFYGERAKWDGRNSKCKACDHEARNRNRAKLSRTHGQARQDLLSSSGVLRQDNNA